MPNFTPSTTITRSGASKYLAANTRLPHYVDVIGNEAFQRRNQIQTVSFPPELSRIGARAFQGCAFLKKIELPATVTELGNAAFSDCSAMKSAVLPAAPLTLPREFLNGNRRLETVTFHGQSRMRDIHPNAFSECQSLSSLLLPPTVTEIHDRAFYRCKSLEQIYFPPELRVIGIQAFYFCGFRTLELPDTLEALDESAFFKCTNLTHVRLPKSVRYIGKWAFHGCNRLQYLEVRHDPEFIGEWIINRSATVRCYQGSKMDRYCRENGFKVEYL